jgi:hypothetical protein
VCEVVAVHAFRHFITPAMKFWNYA